ncbi:hypothetical protein SPB21_07800 [Leptothoe sp. ISB3NOV94-8A]
MEEQRSEGDIAKRSEEASLGSEVLKQGERVEIEVEEEDGVKETKEASSEAGSEKERRSE